MQVTSKWIPLARVGAESAQQMVFMSCEPLPRRRFAMVKWSTLDWSSAEPQGVWPPITGRTYGKAASRSVLRYALAALVGGGLVGPLARELARRTGAAIVREGRVTFVR